jgi:hypothetical protein
MIPSIARAILALRAHGEWCQRLTCSECETNADVVDLLRVMRRLLEQAHRTATWPSVDLRDVIARDDWREEVRILVAKSPSEEQSESVREPPRSED